MSHKNYPQIGPGIKLCTQVPPDVSEEYLTFLEQIGVYYVYMWCDTREQFSYDYLSRFRERVGRHGIQVYNVGAVFNAKSRNIILGTDARDQDIEMFCNNIKMLSEAGIHTTTFVWEPDGVWASTWEHPTRGGALTRKVNMDIFSRAETDTKTRYTQVEIDKEAFVRTGLTHGRIYTEDEMWENYEYFIKRVIPVAEEYGVRLALHPNDPPVPSMGGVACLIKSFDDYKRAFGVMPSEFLGMEFCCGCWLEAADTFGDIYQAIEYFNRERKIFLVHFRNVDKQLPCFVETFIDDGYGNMFDLMKAFVRTDYNGTIVMDHSPVMVEAAGKYGEAAFANGYIKALMRCAENVMRDPV